MNNVSLATRKNFDRLKSLQYVILFSYFLKITFDLFYFTFARLHNSHATSVLITNKQSKIARRQLSYLNKVIKTGPGGLER